MDDRSAHNCIKWLSKKAFELTTPEMQDDVDGVKLNEFIDLDEDVCVTAELTEDDIVS